MGQLGFNVMLEALFGDGGRSARAVRRAIGRRIERVALEDGPEDDGALAIYLDGGLALRLSDAGRSCCESRYMTCEDDLEHYAGATLVDVEVASGEPPPRDDDDDDDDDDYGEGEHEVAFLRVKTDRGYLTVETHNEHNGYYGGFALRARTTSGGAEAGEEVGDE